MSEPTISDIEYQITELQKFVELKDLALKLEKIPEFQKLILEIFCGTECARFVQASADPALSTQERADSLAMAQSAGHLRRWLSMVVRMGRQAEHEVVQGKEAIDEMRAEGQE